MKNDFITLLKALLVEEKGYTPEGAKQLIKKYPSIIIAGIMKGPFALRAIAMALEMEEQK